MTRIEMRAIYACLASPVIVALVLGTLDNLGPALDATDSEGACRPKAGCEPRRRAYRCGSRSCGRTVGQRCGSIPGCE
jgi:hypothetical protein